MADTPGRVPMPEQLRDKRGRTVVWCVECTDGRREVGVELVRFTANTAFLAKLAAAITAGAAWVEDGQRAAIKGGD